MDKELAPKYQPYIAPETQIREGTVRAVVTGTILGMIFGASSLYLVLKVGLTVSASIPVAVISITLYRLWAKMGGKDATILEHNTMQTAGSAGESLAFGVGVTMPAMLILGFDLNLAQVLLVTALGGVLGILMMIPLRRGLIVAQHGTLKFPEGTACAEVLKAGATAESKAAAAPEWREGRSGMRALNATTIFVGFGVGLVYNTLMKAMKLWTDMPQKIFATGPLKGGSVAVEGTPELLGVGYIIGPRIGAIMAGGGVLSYLVLIPMIKFFGEAAPTPIPPGDVPIRDMSPNAIRGAYILYIGAGAVAAGGIISLFKSLPLIWHGLKEGLRDFRGGASAVGARKRTDRDLSMKVVLIGIVVLLAAITLAPSLHMNLLGALLIVVFGFLFVTVSSRLAGEIGTSSNPISGMTVATLLLTCLIFLAIGWTGGLYYVTALSVGAIVCIAASNGGTTAQDLKTGFLVGATPRIQQIAICVGVLASALVLGPILVKLNDAATVYVKAAENVRVEPAKLGSVKTETVPAAQAGGDTKNYRVWHKTSKDAGPGQAGKYLVDESGAAVWFVDPGINGTLRKRADGTEVQKFDAPKATLMSYIIKGILDRELPWGLVLFGAMIAVVLEMAGIPSLAFAVGVYLPLATSMPIFIGGMLRWLVDRQRAGELKAQNMTAEELAADADRSPGVLTASGYIAGGAIAGIVIAINEALLAPLKKRFLDWSLANNPFFESEAHHYAGLLSLIPFALLCGFLYLVAREKLLAGNRAGTSG